MCFRANCFEPNSTGDKERYCHSHMPASAAAAQAAEEQIAREAAGAPASGSGTTGGYTAAQKEKWPAQ
jgi:predicted phage gp36 major capsid-like protein